MNAIFRSKQVAQGPTIYVHEVLNLGLFTWGSAQCAWHWLPVLRAFDRQLASSSRVFPDLCLVNTSCKDDDHCATTPGHAILALKHGPVVTLYSCRSKCHCCVNKFHILRCCTGLKACFCPTLPHRAHTDIFRRVGCTICPSVASVDGRGGYSCRIWRWFFPLPSPFVIYR